MTTVKQIALMSGAYGEEAIEPPSKSMVNGGSEATLSGSDLSAQRSRRRGVVVLPIKNQEFECFIRSYT